MLVSLFAISAVSAAENITDDIVSIEETADDFVNVEFSEIKNCNVNNNGSYLESIMNDSNNDDELLYSFNDDDLISSADENILGASYGVSISCDKAVVTLGSSVTVSIDISPYSYGNYYSYDFVVDVCNSYGSARISSDRYYSNNAYGSKRLYYTFTTGGLDVGEYTLKVVDYMNYRTVFATAKFKIVYSSNSNSYTPSSSSSGSSSTYPSYSDYSVSVSDKTITYGSGGCISPASSSSYKYDYYLKVYDSSGSLKISQEYYGTSSAYSKSYSVGAYELSSGTYTVKIVNYYDSKVMDTATLTVKSSSSSSGSSSTYPSYSDYSVSVSDKTITYGSGGLVLVVLFL